MYNVQVLENPALFMGAATVRNTGSEWTKPAVQNEERMKTLLFSQVSPRGSKKLKDSFKDAKLEAMENASVQVVKSE